MYEILDNRTFCIYFIITLIFIIIGATSILIGNNPYKIIIMLLWMLANVMLLCLIYHSSYILSPNIYKNSCLLDSNTKCFEVNHRIWVLINLLYIIILILSTFWASELNNPHSAQFNTCSGVLIILSGLLLSAKSGNDIMSHPSVFSIGYLTIWIFLTIYVTIN